MTQTLSLMSRNTITGQRGPNVSTDRQPSDNWQYIENRFDREQLLNYNPHDPSTFVNPYEGIDKNFTPEQLQQYIDSGKFLYDAQWKQFDLWYNSETEKVKRMLSAGLNPDLLGLDSASESSSQPTPLSSAGALSVQQQQLEINRQQMINNTIIGVASTIVSAVASIFNIALGVASTAASISAASAQAAKLKKEADLIQENISNAKASLDVTTESLALSSAMADMSKGYKDGMTPQQISQLITYDGTYHDDPNISRSIARHKKLQHGNIDLAKQFLSSKNDVSKENVKDSVLSDYFIPGAEARAALRPLLATAVDLQVTDMIFERDFNKFKTAVVNGADSDTLAKMINQSWENQLKESELLSTSIPHKVISTTSKWSADYYENLNRYNYNLDSAGLGTANLRAQNDYDSSLVDEQHISNDYEFQILRHKNIMMLQRLQRGQQMIINNVLRKSQSGKINIIDAGSLMYYNTIYKNINNSIRSFETNTGASESVTDHGIGAAALALGQKLITKIP